MKNSSISRLGLDWVQLLIVNWSALSKEAMLSLVFKQYVMREHSLKEKLSTFDDIFNNLYFLHLDALSEGVFTHPELPPAPRSNTWCPIDPGKGDGDIPEPGAAIIEDAPERYTEMENRAEKGRSKRAGRKRGSSGWEVEKTPVKRKLDGPKGGGAGGPPEVPGLFSKWEHRDKVEQSKLVVSEAQKLGLRFLDVPEPTRKFKTDEDDKTKEAESELVPSEAQKLGLMFLDVSEPTKKFKPHDDKNKEEAESKLGPSEAQKPGLMFLDVPEPSRRFKPEEDNHKKVAESKLVPSEAQKLGLKFLDGLAPIRNLKTDNDKNKNKEEDIDNASGRVFRESNPERIPAAAASNVAQGLNFYDVEDLRGNRFVSDSVISYYFNQLPSTDEILLQPPSIGQLLTNSEEDHHVIMEPLRRVNHRLVLFVVSDNTVVDRPDGGSHYSLLVYDNRDQSRGPRFVHHDSSSSQMNTHVALHLVNRLRPLLPGAATAPFIQGRTPSQGYYGNDCAIYVMAIARRIYDWWSNRDGMEGDWIEAVNHDVNASSVRELRTMMADIIEAIIPRQQ
ncbi:hypothetical protein ACQ4PT_035215 [Festuca glaucescens]